MKTTLVCSPVPAGRPSAIVATGAKQNMRYEQPPSVAAVRSAGQAGYAS
jgi:hypothetical protein